MPSSRFWSFVLVICVCLGCEPSTVDPTPDEITSRLVSDVQVRIFSPQVPGIELTKEERVANAKATNKATQIFRNIVYSTDDWKEAHSAAILELENNPNLPSHKLEQAAAIFMMHRFLLEGQMTEEKLDTLGLYTDMLLRHQNHDAPLLLKALETMDGYWPESRRNVAAKKAVIAADRFLEERLYCEGCGAKIGSMKAAHPGGNEYTTFLDQASSAVSQLKQIAGES